MNWTPTDSGQLLILAMAIFGGAAIVRGMVIKAKRKREEGGPCS
ncbi:hypothetical protein [Pseudomonas putida]|nr:hypothetical protein [Pseudomonas putida]